VIWEKEKYHYRRNFELSLVISLSLIILIFKFHPDLNFTQIKNQYYADPLITVIDIPRTSQDNPLPATMPVPPKPIVTSLIIEMDELEILEDIEFEENSLESAFIRNSKSRSSGIREMTSLPFIPREIFVSVPKIEDVNGYIKLSLKIGIDGKPKAHNVLENNTDCADCLDKVIEAAYKSLWVPVRIEGDKIEYWLEKTYTFN